MSEQSKLSKTGKSIKSQFSAEAIAAGGGIIGLLTLSLLIYQNYLMSDQTAEMIATNKEMIYQRKLQEKERFNHLIEILYDSKKDKAPYKSSYKREIRDAQYISKLRTEAFHEAVEYLTNAKRELDFTGGFLGKNIDFRAKEFHKVNFEGADLREAKLFNVLLKDSNLSDCDFYYADMSQGNFFNSNFHKSILGKANLSGAHLAKANLSHTVLWDTNLTGANLNGANLCNAALRNVDLTETDLSNVLYNRNTVWPEDFDLISADLKFKMKLVEK